MAVDVVHGGFGSSGGAPEAAASAIAAGAAAIAIGAGALGNLVRPRPRSMVRRRRAPPGCPPTAQPVACWPAPSLWGGGTMGGTSTRSVVTPGLASSAATRGRCASSRRLQPSKHRCGVGGGRAIRASARAHGVHLCFLDCLISKRVRARTQLISYDGNSVIHCVPDRIQFHHTFGSTGPVCGN